MKFSTLKKYMRLHWAFFRASFAADIEYRLNFLIRIITDVAWYFAQIITFEVIYSQTPVLGTWTIDKVRIFLGLLFMMDALYMIFLHDNLEQISEKVQRGDLDLLLTKPVNSQFMISCQRVSTAFIGNFLLGLAWFLWAVHNYTGHLAPMNIFWLCVLVPVSFLIQYACKFIFVGIAIFTVRADNFQYLWYQLYRLGMRPDTIYQPWIKYLILTVLPMAFIASVPSRALLDPPSYGLYAWGIALAAILFYVSSRFWRYALRFYSSASS